MQQETDVVVAMDRAPLVYLDCNRCDFVHVRREIGFVNYVRDPNLAEIHILVTDQATGSGGRTFTLFYYGRRRFEKLHQTLSYTSDPTNTATEQREGLTEMLKLGLVPYLAQTALATELRLVFQPSSTAAQAPRIDPWNSWIFELYGGGNFSNEATQSAWSARYGFFADRVTQEWKIRLRPYFNDNVRTFRRGEDLIRSAQRRHGFDSFVIKSLGDHWGAGLFGEYITTTFDNLRHGLSLAPAVEYSLFPYQQSSRRQVTFAYRIGIELADYIEETIYGRTAETLMNQSLNAGVQIHQTWGSVSGRFSGSHYLHDLDHYRLTFSGQTAFRIARGVSITARGSFERVHDQLALPRGDASLEDILLQQRRLATSYLASGQVGLSYTFGSFYTNVVNPRF